MQCAFERPAEREDHQCYREGDCHQPPLSKSTNDSDAGGEPDASCAGQAFDLSFIAVNDDPCAKKTDPGQQTLDNATCCVRQPARFQRCRIGEQDHRCGGKTHQTKCAKANRLSMQVTVKADNSGRQRGDAEP